jgi:hypothetical protein
MGQNYETFLATRATHDAAETLTPAVCSFVRCEAACVAVPSAEQRPLQLAAHSGGHVFAIGGAIAQHAFYVESCSRIRRDMGQNNEMFLAT